MNFGKLSKRDDKRRNNLLESEADSYWLFFTNSEKKAEKEAAAYNKLLVGTPGKASVEMARNFDMEGREYGVYISGMTERTMKMLDRRFLNAP